MPKMYHHHFTVSGRGHFPIDMLRYDRCSPVSSADVDKLTERHDNAVRIELVHTGPRQWGPTEGRWNSFGWAVAHHLSRAVEA